MMNRLIDTLSRILYRNELSMDPGAFEGFLTPVPDLSQISSGPERQAR